MSLPYPHDRARARQDQGEQPYKDAREALGEKDAKLQVGAAGDGERPLQETDEERLARIEQETADRLKEIGEEVRQANDQE